MPNLCPKCLGPDELFHSCNDKDKGLSLDFDQDASDRPIASLILIVGLSPFLGFVFDYLAPMPSSIVNSVLLSLLGSAIFAMFWVSMQFKGRKSFDFYLKNFKNFLYTPNILKVLTTTSNRKAKSFWIVNVIVCSILQITFVTPGNADYLASRVTSQINEASGADLDVECPSNFLFFYRENIKCKVKTGIFGITVPARANLSPFLGNSEIKVTLR